MSQPCEDKLYKIRPLFEKLNAIFKSTTADEMFSIDEQVVSFNGKSTLKTYNPAKPKKWGYKIYMFCLAQMESSTTWPSLHASSNLCQENQIETLQQHCSSSADTGSARSMA
ncbi:hypothetical protein RRG08_007554 [Elysia crispata]|uniref:PiggyBac transposable element-derived protein domain-containing protein n=1 Tax=Elysia crispata TaxID=231223 RepID=A0AAE0YEQ7_9GAST|nr:hypothetical protein RRG08_007554 [Elysia crispata]